MTHHAVLAATRSVLASVTPSQATSSNSPVVGSVVAAIFIIVGLLNLTKPDIGWRMSRWQYRNPAALQPSAAGLAVARVTGAVAIVVGIIVIVVLVGR